MRETYWTSPILYSSSLTMATVYRESADEHKPVAISFTTALLL